MAELIAAGSGRFRVTGELTFSTVPLLAARSDGLPAFPVGETVEIDLGGVERADSAGLALLTEWLRRARAGGCAIRFSQVPEQMLAIARISGLGAILPLDGPD